MFKFLHAADIHLDSPLLRLERYEGAPVEEMRQATRRALGNLVQLALSECVSFVLIAGDLYDGDWKDYNTGLYFVSQLAKLREAGIPVLLITGNHDAANRMTRILRLPEGAHVFPTDKPGTLHITELGVAVHGQGFATQGVKRDLSMGYPSAVSGCFNIGLLHTCATGREGHEPYAPCTIDGLLSKGYDYWALGHVHQREVLNGDPPIIFPGNIQGRHVREAGPRGCVLVSVDNSGRASADFRPLDVIRWERCIVDVSESESGYDAINRIAGRLEELRERSDGLPLVARVEMVGACRAHTELAADPERWANEVRSVAMDSTGGEVWVEKVKFQTTLPSSGEAARISEGPIGELLQVVDKIRSDPTRLHTLGTSLGDLWQKLPKELKEGDDAIVPQDAAWLAGIVDQVTPMLLGRLMSKRDAR
jgi:exonuclease SbcD